MVKIFLKKFNFKKQPNIRFLLLAVLVGLLGLLFIPQKLPLAGPSNVNSFATQSEVAYLLPKCLDHDPNVWHPSTQKNAAGKIICIYGHEHGDPPPDWVSRAGYSVGFDSMADFMANTSPMEDDFKHPGMKGFNATIQGLQVYARIHLMSNPLDRTARYHSYELFIKDQTGAVSHFQGWLNTGDSVTDRIPYHDSTYGAAGLDPGRRPIVWAATRQACLKDRSWCIELWSMTTSSWGPDIIWTINDPTTYFQPGEKYDADISHWDLTGKLGGDRTMVISLFRNSDSLKKRGLNQAPVGSIWATQFGDIVSGPKDQLCSQSSVKFGVEYQNVCLENYIAPTLPEISGVNNGAEKQFDLTGVQVPN